MPKTLPHRFAIFVGAVVCLLASADLLRGDSFEPPLSITPTRVSLHGRASRQQIIVTGLSRGRKIDLTRAVAYRSLTPQVVTVDSQGLLAPVGNGQGIVVAEAGGLQARVTVQVTGADRQLPIDFQRDVIPIFSRFGCNSGPCHGKARGQNGFKLSLLGFDPQLDYDALMKEGRGRRVFMPSPERSLLLLKPSGQVPHGGGLRLKPDGFEIRLLRRWIASGAPRQQPLTPQLSRITVDPAERIMVGDERQQFIVTAYYSDVSTRDVTRLAAFQSNESAIASVDEHGLVAAGPVVGEAAVMARYMGQIAVVNVAIPLKGSVPAEFYAKLPRYNFIDKHVWTKLERLGITPSQPATDHKFLRRASIDVIGRVPTPEETRAFLNDDSPKKRERLIDHLLAQPDFADHWANKWVDLLRPNPYRVGLKSVLNYDYWIRNSFRKNKPYDQFVRELVAAQGSTWRDGAPTLLRDRRSPDEITTIVSQLFLGIRLECAKCHHHPFEVWGQDDFYSFSAYFAKLGRKGTGLSTPISGSEEFFFTGKNGSVRHPLTGQVMQPRPLFGTTPQIDPAGDPRDALAEWLTSDENSFFVQVMANRVWADIMGRGLVEPVDDLRATNPPTNAPLLEALGEDFRRQGYDLKKLIRRITTSYVYGLSSRPSERNVVDIRNYSRHYRQRLRAEVMLDAVGEITEVPESFSAMPPGSKAKELWTRRVGSLFLDTFGRPNPNQDPPCERTDETTVVQALHLMNSENLFRKVSADSGRAARLANSDKKSSEIVEELYLLVYSRVPDEEEHRIGSRVFEKEGISRRQATEDLLWALLNTPEFIFKD